MRNENVENSQTASKFPFVDRGVVLSSVVEEI